MKLRYLTLCDDLFKEHSPYTKEEMRCFGARLRQESAYITDYVKRGVNEEFDFDCARLNLCCTLSQPRDNIRKAESVHEIDVPFDMNYFSMTPPQKQQYLIDITENSLQRFCECEGWDFSVFKKHIDLLRSNPSFAEFYIPKKSCRKDQLSAKIYCVQNMTETIFFVDFFFKRTHIRRKFFAVSSPDAFWYRSNIFRLEWRTGGSGILRKVVGLWHDWCRYTRLHRWDMGGKCQRPNIRVCIDSRERTASMLFHFEAVGWRRLWIL